MRPTFFRGKKLCKEAVYNMLRTISSAIRSTSATVGARSFALRNFSADGHDDFAPKKKAPEPEGMDGVLKMIEGQVKDNDIMLYMKGTPSAPQCGFSGQTVRILNAAGVDFSSVNVLEYPMIREGVKNFSQWPTIPQLYVKGEFVGGCEIVTDMFKDGSLDELLKGHKLTE
jgi:monothiol glutaredoxin